MSDAPQDLPPSPDSIELALAVDAATRLAEDVAAMRAELARSRTQMRRLKRELTRAKKRHEKLARTVRTQQARIESLRLDRQIRSFPTAWRRRRRRSGGSSQQPE